MIFNKVKTQVKKHNLDLDLIIISCKQELCFLKNSNLQIQITEEVLAQSDLSGIYNVFVYDNIIANVDIIRNEELVLLYAEALHISNPSKAIDAINIIRNAAELDDYTGGDSPAELVDEILLQRRYSLFAEGGHRWIDMRRFNRLDQLPNDRPGDNVFVQFPTPVAEGRQELQ